VVQVETGDTDDFEPITDVYIVLYGEFGNSGQRYLSKSKEGGLLFELFKVSSRIMLSLTVSPSFSSPMRAMIHRWHRSVISQPSARRQPNLQTLEHTVTALHGVPVYLSA